MFNNPSFHLQHHFLTRVGLMHRAHVVNQTILQVCGKDKMKRHKGLDLMNPGSHSWLVRRSVSENLGMVVGPDEDEHKPFAESI